MKTLELNNTGNKTKNVRRALEMRLAAVKREENQLEAALRIYDNGNTGTNGKERFRSLDLVPVLQRMKKDFTLDDLLAAAHKKNLNIDKTQLYSALNSLRSMVHIVVAGIGRRVAVYRYVGSEE